MDNYFHKSYKGVKLSYHKNTPDMPEGKILITLNNPPVNALSLSLIDSLHEILLCINSDKDIKLVVIAGAGDHFSAGADLKERSVMSDEEALNFLDKINNCFDLLEKLEVPTICFLTRGATLGGGAELALCCDFVIATNDDCKHWIGFPETSIGIIPGAGGTYRISKKMNQGLAKYWILSGKQFSLREACRDGFVDFYFDNHDNICDFENLFLEKSRISLIAAKTSINKCYLESDKRRLKLIELKEYRKTLDSPERKEALEKYKGK